MLFHKCCIIILIITLILLYIYCKKENFTSPQPTIKEEQKPIDVQVRDEISRVLEISKIRIYNLVIEGNINKNELMVDFDILDNNFNKVQNEISKDQAIKKTIKLINNDMFFIKINNKSIILRKFLNRDKQIQTNLEKHFNNEGLKDISKFVKNKYISVPNDESLTNFYTLGFDKNYNIIPKILK